MRLPYLLPPIHQTDLHKLKGTNRFRLYLSHGVITDAKKAQQVPQAVHDELYKVYGHVKQTEVVVVNEDGTYSIYTRPRRRTTSDGTALSQFRNINNISETENE